jgi:signal transduction histidine kinase
VTVSADFPGSQPAGEPRRSDEARSNQALEAALHSALCAQVTELAARWTSQSRTILLLDSIGVEGNDGPVRDSEVARSFVDALLAAFAAGDEESDAAITAGLQFGAEAFARGASLHHTAKAVDLLVTMTMYAMERAVSHEDMPHGRVADGLWLARRLQRRGALLSLAATRGYTQAYGEAYRDQFRHLRHDLRNPLGTIKSVLALMDDESVPAEARANPNFRAMAKRNARSLEEMIADRLSDAAVPLSVMAGHDVSVRTIACTVRRDLRSEAEYRGVAIIVEPSSLRGRFDAPGLELLLRGTIQAALYESAHGEQLRLEFEGATEDRATVVLSAGSGRAPIEKREALDRLRILAERIGASITFSDRIRLSVSMPRAERPAGVSSERERSVPQDSGELGDGKTVHDLRGPREGEHGQPSAL